MKPIGPALVRQPVKGFPTSLIALTLATALTFLSGCATSFAPEEASTSLTAGPQVDAPLDEKDLRIQQLFIRGLTRALVDDHRQAIFLFEQALQLDGDQPAVLHALAESHAALGELETALYYSRRALRLSPSNRDLMLHHVTLQQRKGDIDGALESYEQWLTVYPGDTDLRLKAGELLIDLGREQEALAHYRDIIDNDGDNLEVRFRMLQVYNGMGNTDGMLNTVKGMLELDPTNGALMRILADVYLERNQTAQAIRVLEQTVDSDPGDIEAALALAELYREIGREGDAEELTASASNDPFATMAERMAVASKLYERSGSDEKAAEQAAAILKDLIERGEESAEALFMLGNLRHRESHYGEAADLLLRALEIDPRHPDEWARAATALHRSGEGLRALRVVEEGLMLFPGQFPLLSIGVEASLAADDFDRAAGYASEAIEVLDRGPSADQLRAHMLERLGDAYAGLGRPDEAARYWEDALEIVPDLASVREKLGSRR